MNDVVVAVLGEEGAGDFGNQIRVILRGLDTFQLNDLSKTIQNLLKTGRRQAQP